MMKMLLTSRFSLSALPSLMMPLLCLLFILGVWATPARATNAYDLPAVSVGEPTWVVDEADVISRVNEGKLNTLLENLANETGNEVRVVAIRRLDYGETTDSFAEELFDRWFATPEAQTNQTLLVIDTLTNKSALIAGDGVKPVLSDDITQSVLDANLGIPVREGNKYNEGLLSASDRLAAILSGQPDPGAPVAEDSLDVESTFAKAEDTDAKSSTIWVIGLLLAATLIPMLTYYAYVGFPGR